MAVIVDNKMPAHARLFAGYSFCTLLYPVLERLGFPTRKQKKQPRLEPVSNGCVSAIPLCPTILACSALSVFILATVPGHSYHKAHFLRFY